jgi:simple sugar transport system ATP-binding protein
MMGETLVEAASAASSPVPAAGAVPRMRVTGIRKTFGSNQALRGVDLDLWGGECLGLVGDNAAGKSTFTKILAGTYIADEGTIEIDGEKVDYSGPAEARERGIEMVYQDLALCDTIDVAGNLYLGRELRRGPFLDKGAMQQGAREMLTHLEIRIPNVAAKVAQLSGGQRQSIAIARSASFNPRVLILDEPTSALAVAEVEAVLALIRRLKAKGVAVVLITHRLQDLFRVCDRIAVMYEGTKVAERSIQETSLEDIVRLIVGEGHRG